MRNLSNKLGLIAAVSCLAWMGNVRSVRAAEENPPPPDERLQRMERRLNELAERQEQMLRRFGEQREQRIRRFGDAPRAQAPMAAPDREALRPPTPPPAPVGPAVGKPHQDRPLLGLFLLVCLICNILLAIWIAMDIRKRGEGSGLFIALAVVAGVPAAIIYSLARIGDRLPGAVKPAA